MAKGFNQVTLMGNLTRDPELRTTSGGRSVCSFSLAVNRTWRDSDGNQKEAVTFVDCTAWGKAGEIISQYMQKGRALLVSGRLESSSWEQEGKKRTKLEVIVEDFNFISDGTGSGGGSRPATSSSSASSSDSKPSKAKKKEDDDVVIEDIDEEPVDLSDIPF